MIIGTLMALETCLILGQVSHNLLHWKKNFLTDVCGLGETETAYENSVPNYHQDHIAGNGKKSIQHYNLVHNFIPLLQAMKIPAAKAGSGQGMGKIGENFGVELDQSQK